MPPPIRNASTLPIRLLRTPSLPETFAPPITAANGCATDSSSDERRLDLALHQETGVRGQVVGDTDRRRVGAVCRAEGVIHEDLAIARERLRVFLLVRLLFRVEAQVLEHHHLARLEPRNRVPRADAQRVARDRHRHPQQPGETLRHRPKPSGLNDLALRPAEVAHQHDGRAVLEQVDDRGIARADPRVVLDLAVLDRDVEVDANEDALALRIEVSDGLLFQVFGLRC